MKPRFLALALVMAALASLTPVVAAQNETDGRTFAWPIAEWLARSGEAHSDVQDQSAASDLPMAAVIRSGPRSSGAVALTFDDGFNSAACRSIADTLRRNDAVGTFFINGMHLLSEPTKWRNILQGMPVGNHTRSHRDLTGEPHPVVKKQILENERIHEEVLGRPMLKVLRPPYGAYGDRVRIIAKQLGYDRLAMWNVDTQDWKPGTSARAIVRRAARAPAGSIILMHCSRGATAKAMPKIVRRYQARGIKLEGLETVMRGARSAPDGSEPETYGRS